MDDADESANEARLTVGGAAPQATAATSAAAPFGGAAVAVVIGIGLAALESSHVATIGGMSALIFCSLVAFIVNWIAFVPSWIGKTERFYDLMGSCTYLAIVTIGVIWAFRRDALTLVLAAMIAVWALRLGSFLFARVRDVGGDARFDNITGSFPTLLMTWTLQGLWVFVTAGAALTAMFSAHDRSLGAACRHVGCGFRHRGGGGPAEAGVSAQRGEDVALYQHRSLGVVEAPELLRRNPFVGRDRSDFD